MSQSEQETSPPEPSPGYSPAPAPIPVATVRGHEAIVKKVAWSPGSTLIATADVENNVRLWRAADTAAPVRSLAEPVDH